jgi:osmoprotectant transport system ATP-binding protein
MISLDRVSKSYNGKPAVDRLSLSVEKGEICVLIGPSGCGKSTTLRMVNRMVEPDSGTIMVNGTDIRTQTPESLRRGIGYVIQSIGLFPHMTVSENIGTVPRLLKWDPQVIRDRVDELLLLIGLDPVRYRSRYPKALSGGEAQRVGVARALAADPPIMLMDEPFGAVDPLTRQRLQEEFRELQQTLHKTVLFVTHDVDEAVILADRIGIMRQGTLMQWDHPEKFLQEPADAFVRSFLGADFSLSMLSRLKAIDFCCQAYPGVAPEKLPAITSKASLKEAFAVFVATGSEYLRIVNDSGKTMGHLALIQLLQPFAGDPHEQ